MPPNTKTFIDANTFPICGGPLLPYGGLRLTRFGRSFHGADANGLLGPEPGDAVGVDGIGGFRLSLHQINRTKTEVYDTGRRLFKHKAQMSGAGQPGDFPKPCSSESWVKRGIALEPTEPLEGDIVCVAFASPPEPLGDSLPKSTRWPIEQLRPKSRMKTPVIDFWDPTALLVTCAPPA